MKRSGHLAASILLLSIGCKETPQDAGDTARREPPRHEIAAHDSGTEKIVRVAPEMLRDLRLTTAAAEARVSAEGVTALGELRVNEEAYAEIGTPLAARVVRLLRGIGDSVAAGEPILELHSPELGKAFADLRRTRARADFTRQVLERRRGLAADRIVPQRELQEAEADAAAAAAEVEAATATLRALGVDDATRAPEAGAVLVLRSPIRGTVIDRSAVRGQMADPAQALARVADLSSLWLVAHVFERDAVRVHIGTAVHVDFPALPGRPFAGRVLLVGKQVDVNSRTIPVRIEVANDDDVLRPGMSATARIPLSDATEPIVAVPAAALQHRENGWCVYIPRGEGTFELREVGRGRDIGGAVEIINGLRAGETVVVDGAFLLRAETDRGSSEGEHHDH